MRVSEVMSTRVVAVRPDATLKEAVRRLAEHAVTALPVVEPGGELVGIVSEADAMVGAVVPDPRAHLLLVPVPGDAWPARVADVMTRTVLTVSPHSDLADAADLMLASGVKSLPVLDSERVVGMLSRRDVILALSRRDELIQQECTDLFRTLGFGWTVRLRQGVATVTGPSSAWERDCAERLAATVPGVVGVVMHARGMDEGHSEFESSGLPTGGF